MSALATSECLDPWEAVKPILESLWLEKKWKLDRIVGEMRVCHSFHRVESQYKTQFKIWGWSKNVRKNDMTKVLKCCKGRAAVGRHSTQVAIGGKRVDKEKVRRAMKDEIRAVTKSLALDWDKSANATGHILPFTNNFFLKWNLPYLAMRHSYGRPFDHRSPFDHATPYSDIEVTTPASAASPNTAPSPRNQVTKQLMMVERARMFAQGDHERLLKLMDGEERRTLSDWLYQYWFFSFKTAKHLGKGPKRWTAELLNFDKYLPIAHPSLPETPQDLAYPSTPLNNDDAIPSDLCRWYIHVREQYYEPTLEDRLDPLISSRQDPDDDTTWTSWSSSEQQVPLQTHLQNALENNDFSPMSINDLPVAIPQLAQAAKEERSDALLIESLGFSIMSRNTDQILRIFRQLHAKNIDPAPLPPFHLVTSFLDGSKSCCDVITVVAKWVSGAKVYETYHNEHGHTILDNLMIAIVKSHTVARPAAVDEELKDVTRFVGEEVDICGRWDADTACVRQLHANGRSSIPPDWKHKFCHTSTQTICHCIRKMFLHMPGRLLLDTPSGLHIRRCFDPNCGKKLQMQPLHSLVMTAYHLATQGRDDEDLFGVLACALCLIFHGFDPSITADISVTALLSSHSVVECDHAELTAADLAEKILVTAAIENWSAKLRTGWAVLIGVLRRCEAAHLEHAEHLEQLQHIGHAEDDDDTLEEPASDVFMGATEPEYEVEAEHLEGTESFCFARQKDLGALWSSVQAEWLSYRRLDDGLGWLSAHFSMETLRDQLENDEDLMVGYVEHNLLKAHCACHSFGMYPFPVLSEVIDPNLANVDLWGRATYGETIED